MKQVKSKAVWLLALSLIVSFLFYDVEATEPQPTSFIDLTVDDASYGKPVFAFGSGLTNEEIVLTAELMGIQTWEQVEPLAITAEDWIQLVNPQANPQSKMFSSVLIQWQPEGTGARVQVLTPELISKITPIQYSSAALTAGIKNAKIVVASVKPATGESALTGVYKALAERGEALPEQRVHLAQEELKLVSNIALENKDKENFDLESYDRAILALKESLVEEKAKLKETNTQADLSFEKIYLILQNTMNNYQLGDVLSKEQLTKLGTYFEKWAASEAAEGSDIKEALKDLQDSLLEWGETLYKEAKDSGLLEKIQDGAKEGYRELKDSKLFKDLKDGALNEIEKLDKESLWEGIKRFIQALLDLFKGCVNEF